ncbi:MAG: hypothetical protein U1A72_13335 [Sulfuritalea sp.]|nr:hypothetical protein [Sulfuritalea sp.]
MGFFSASNDSRMDYRPSGGLLAVISFLVAVAWWSEFVEPANTAKWIALSALVPLAFLRARYVWTWAHVGVALWLALAALSLLWTPSVLDGTLALWQFALLAAVFFAGSSLTANGVRACLLAFAIGVGVSGLVALAQAFGTLELNQVSPVAGLYFNKNQLAEVGLLALVAALIYRAWWALPGAALAFVLPMSRGAGVALALVGCVWLWRRSRAAAVIFATLPLAMGAVYLIELPTGDHTVGYRLALWSVTLQNLTLFGHGIGSFTAAFPAFAAASPVPVPDGVFRFALDPGSAHNDLIQLASDTGVAALLLAAVVIAALRNGSDEAPHLVLVAFAGLALVAFPLYSPVQAFVGALCAGYLCGAWADVGDRNGDWRDPAYRGAAIAGIELDPARQYPRRGGVAVPGPHPRGQRVAARDDGRHAAADRAGRAAPGAAPRAGFAAAQLLARLSPHPHRRPGGRPRDGVETASHRPRLAANQAT